MSEIKDGDLVEATKGADVIRGHIQIGCEGGSWVGATKWTLKTLAEHAWTVSLIEAALPTVEGSVVRDGGHLGRVYVLWDGKWRASYLDASYTEEELRKCTRGLVVLYEEPAS